MQSDAEFLRRARQSYRSSFGSVRVDVAALTRRDLRSRHVLWLHGWAMGLLTLGVMWLTTALLRWAGVDTLALRYALTLGMGYLCYLALVRVWAGMLIRREAPDIPDLVPDLPGGASSHPGSGGGVQSGGGGDFGGGGADAGFDGAADAAFDAPADAFSGVLDEVASGAFEAAGAADAAVIVVIPVLAVFMVVLATVFGAGWLLWLSFGTEALLAVAVELAFAYTASRTVVQVEREGWLLAAIRLTWKPLLGALICAVLLGALIDHFMPDAGSLPEAMRLWRGR